MDSALIVGPTPLTRRPPWQAERQAAMALFSENSHVAGEEVDAIASSLAGPGRRAAALELVASSLALCKVQEGAMAGIVAALIHKKDLRNAAMMSRVLKSTTERIAVLAKTLSALDSSNRYTVVVSAGTTQVAVGLGEGVP